MSYDLNVSVGLFLCVVKKTIAISWEKIWVNNINKYYFCFSKNQHDYITLSDWVLQLEHLKNGV